MASAALRSVAVIVGMSACGDREPPQPAKVQPAKVEPAKVEPAKVEPAKVEPVPPPDEAAAPSGEARASVFFRKAPQIDRATVWHASAADPAVPEQLPFVVDFEPGGAVGVGTTTPLLAPNGTWLAYLDRGLLHVAMLDGSVKERVTRHGPAQVSVQISGFSPDSATLLFAQGEVQAEDALPLPGDVKPGFSLLSLSDFHTRHLPELSAFEAWIPGTDRVVLERRQPGATELVAYTIADGKTDVQQRTPDNYGFTQIVVGTEHIVYVRVPKEHRSQVVRAKLDGSALLELSPEGEFAQYQWPRLSTDGKQVAYRDGARIMRVSIDGGATTEVTTCTSSDCEHTWESAVGLLVRDGPDLARYDNAGKTAIANDVIGFAVAGEPG